MSRNDGNIFPDGPRNQLAGFIVRGYLPQRLEYQRMMANQQIGFLADRLGQSRFDRIEGNGNSADLGGRVADLQADIIPLLRQGRRAEGIDHAENILYPYLVLCRHADPKKKSATLFSCTLPVFFCLKSGM